MKVYIPKRNMMDQIAIVTIGFPFVSFKLLLGIAFFKLLYPPFNYIVGVSLAAWSIIDLLINGLNLCMLLLRNRYCMNLCLLTCVFAAKKSEADDTALAWKDVGTASDVLLSFVLVAIMAGGDLFRYLSPWQLSLWSVSVVVNVLGAGVSRIILSLQQVKSVHVGCDGA